MSSKSQPKKLIPPEPIYTRYDYDKISHVVDALDFLRKEAVNAGDEDVYIIINSAFNMCLSAYYLALRAKCEPNLPSSEH